MSLMSLIFLVPFLVAVNTQSVKNDMSHLQNVTKCDLFMYSLGGEFSVYEKKKDEDWKNETSMIFEDPTTVDGKCKDKEAPEKELILTYEGNGKTLKLQFFMYLASSYWEIQNITATIDGKSLAFTSDNMYASKYFSWSCNRLSLVSAGEVKNVSTKFYLTLNRFQIQPFESNRSVVFDDSYDCTTWFTIPVWMGLITVAMFTFISAVGVYLLFSIKTMDRFENPKGKTLTVPITD